MLLAELWGGRMQHNKLIQIVLFSLFLNLFCSEVATYLNLPIFLDSTGTMLAAVTIGPWVGGILGLMTNVIKGLYHSPQSIPFGLVNMAIGILTGYLAIQLKDYRKPFAPLLVGCATAIAAPLVAAPIATYMYGGISAHSIDKFVVTMMDSGQSILSSTFWGRIPYSFVDKLISAYLVLFILQVWLTVYKGREVSIDAQ